jgi:hypothetical protein
MSGLFAFGLNDTEVALAELGSHLKTHVSDLYRLSWRRFEELIEDIFKRFGFRTVLTQQSRDGGADVVLLRDDSQEAHAIVECKKYPVTKAMGHEDRRHPVTADRGCGQDDGTAATGRVVSCVAERFSRATFVVSPPGLRYEAAVLVLERVLLIVDQRPLI